MKVLDLSLKKQWFDVMVTGEKTIEYRKTGKWINSRLCHTDGTEKQYDLIKFVNGYGADKPYFICKYDGVTLNTEQHTLRFSNGHDIEVAIGDTMIFLGEIIERGNIKANAV